MSTATASALLVTVACPGCGHPRLVAPSTVEMIRLGKASGLCPRCGKLNGPTVRVTAAHRRYWLDRFTVGEIVEMAEALFGPRRSWPETAGQKAAA